MRPLLLAELLVLTLLAALGASALAWQIGQWGWNWDAINHHVYLGLTAEQPRWSLDVLAAGTQVYQYPYLYWPVYKIAQMSGSGLAAAVGWSAAQAALLLPPVWLMAHRLIDTGAMARWEAALLRSGACVLAFLNAIVLHGLGMTSNDLLAALPLLWAVALQCGHSRSDKLALVCAALWGVSTAFKWSNGLMLPVLLFWWWQSERPHLPWRRGLALAAGAVLGFGLVYLPWGLQLWAVRGNPFYPFFRSIFPGH
jgi:hypothetical protein